MRADFKQRLADRSKPRCGTATAARSRRDGHARAQKEHLFSAKFACPVCEYSLPELEPRMFSFNNPVGACPRCDGLGAVEVLRSQARGGFPNLSLACGAIKGWDRRNQFYFQMLQSLAKHLRFDIETAVGEAARAHAEHRAVRLGDARRSRSRTSGDRGRGDRRARVRGRPPEPRAPLSRDRFARRCARSSRSLNSRPARVRRRAPEARGAAREGRRRATPRDLRGLGAGRSPRPRSISRAHAAGSESAMAERIVREIVIAAAFPQQRRPRLPVARSLRGDAVGRRSAAHPAGIQIGSGLTGVMYVLDEPSIGLHQRDNDRLIDTLKHLRDLGNTVIVVEHDEEAIRAADHIVDMGPGAGEHGGRIVAKGTPEEHSSARAHR